MSKGLQQSVEIVVAAMSRQGAAPLTAEQIRRAKLGGRESGVSAGVGGDGAHFEDEVLGPDPALAKGELDGGFPDKGVMRSAAVTSYVPDARFRHGSVRTAQTSIAIDRARFDIYCACG